MTGPQRDFLARAAQLYRHDMGIMPRGTLQHRMASLLEDEGWLTYGGMGVHEETGGEGPMWRITEAGIAALAASRERRRGLAEMTQMTEDAGGHDKERR